MSKITGVADFKDFVQQEDFDYLKKIDIYIGYMSYLMDAPIVTKDFIDKEDFAPLYHYTINCKSLYRNLESGYVVLNERDFLSVQEDTQAGKGYSSVVKKIHSRRKGFEEELLGYGYSEEDAKDIARYRFELEDKIGHAAEQSDNNQQTEQPV